MWLKNYIFGAQPLKALIQSVIKMVLNILPPKTSSVHSSGQWKQLRQLVWISTAFSLDVQMKLWGMEQALWGGVHQPPGPLLEPRCPFCYPRSQLWLSSMMAVTNLIPLYLPFVGSDVGLLRGQGDIDKYILSIYQTLYLQFQSATFYSQSCKHMSCW